jgi:hypothetical protein
MCVAGRQLTECIANADNRPAIKHVVGHALVFHPAPVNDAIFVFPAKPTTAPEFLCHIFIRIDGKSY